jgi:hypothetical protein
MESERVDYLWLREDGARMIAELAQRDNAG